MKKVVGILVVLVVGLVAVNYVRTGEIGLLAGSSGSPEVDEVRQLEGRFAAAKRDFSQAARASALGGGMDMTGDAEVALGEVKRIEQALRDLKPRLTDESARDRAVSLERAISEFRRTLS
jgi:hypothetical protein